MGYYPHAMTTLARNLYFQKALMQGSGTLMRKYRNCSLPGLHYSRTAHLDISKDLLNILLYSIKFQNITSIELISNGLFMAAFGFEILIEDLVNSY